MPFIYLPKLDLKILIDSGASDSIINTGPAFQKFFNYFYFKPFILSGFGGKTFSKNNIRFPILSEIGIKNEINLHVVDWHTKYDALLGSTDLRNLGANIDYKNKILNIGNIKIPFYLEHTSKIIPCQKININHYLKIPVTIENGEVVLPEIRLKENIIIPECITVPKEGYCQIHIDNAEI